MKQQKSGLSQYRNNMEQYSVQTVKDGSEVAEDLHSLAARAQVHYSGYQKTVSLSPLVGVA